MTNIIEKLNWRYATKAFNPEKKVSPENIEKIIESFRLSPSSFGLQPWKLVHITNQETKNSLVEHSWGQQQISNCSDLFVLCRKNNFNNENITEFINDIAKTRWVPTKELKGYQEMMEGFLSRMNEEQIKQWTDKQVYIALWMMMSACAQLEVDACPVEGFVADKYDEVLGLKEKGISSVVVLPVGYRSNEDKYAELEKVRFTRDEILETM